MDRHSIISSSESIMQSSSSSKSETSFFELLSLVVPQAYLLSETQGGDGTSLECKSMNSERSMAPSDVTAYN